MPLDLEEQEQVDELKAWWNRHGTLILAAVLAALVAFVGWLAWTKYESGQAAQASVLYETAVKAAQAGDAKALRDAGGTLARILQEAVAEADQRQNERDGNRNQQDAEQSSEGAVSNVFEHQSQDHLVVVSGAAAGVAPITCNCEPSGRARTN